MSDWKLSYSGIYGSGAKVKTEQNAESGEVCLTLRREFGEPDQTYIMTREQATEIAYALLRALTQIDEANQPAGPPE